ncbi:MAG: hypothetical protein QQW96_15760 [Tychonema bourrellyi B0820]|uniref:Uncharacterized protein n=1 Tax=Tychonema bourrellyi FEM_GT703 TaxID=2040638 RepID=A0A2G4EXE8_9CYAN|nr:hypothetical protein [Tychonema bourrellyi]MDQ2099089.1 hypothetical protein [Tychonema bourrellyi B0820]PHX53827.1 hypothetical protein CP500_019400 [Tychonema bourrellyi FEM_GT703]
MSSSNYGPYKSQLLNFISKQSRQVADNCDRTWRQVQSATLNATQILLYPAYLLVQSSRMLARQLRESSQKVDLPELQEFVEGENLKFSQNSSLNLWNEGIGTESAIVEIVHLAENLLLPSQTQTNYDNVSFLINGRNATPDIGLQRETQFTEKTTNTSQKLLLEHQPKTQLAEISINNVATINTKPEVRGIATFLPARSLVLVGDENQILDILTVEQQELLESRITWEVANSGPGRREIAKQELKFNLGLEAAAEKSQLPPVRGFWQLMAWVQTSPLAVKRNQFGESILAVKKAIDANTDHHLIISQQITGVKTDRRAIASGNAIDYNTSELTSNFYPKFDRANNSPSFLNLLDRAAVNLEEFNIPQVSKNTVESIIGQPEKIDTATSEPKLSPNTREIVENYARHIEEMIWSSVDYLLGKETAASENTEKSVAIKYALEQQELENTEKNGEKSDRPWLNLQDLFGEQSPATSSPISTSQIATNVKPKIDEIEKLSERRSTLPSTSPYPQAIHTLLTQIKLSLFTKVSKSKPQKELNLETTQKNSLVPTVKESTPTEAEETELAEPKKPEITGKTSKIPSIATTPGNKSSNESPDEYLETKAESMGYIKHPLEQVLEWLDKIMLRLETIAVQLWEWAKINLQKIINSKDKIR